MRHRADIVIVGSGIVGLTTALALTEAGLEVTVVEAGAFESDGADEIDAPPLPPWSYPAPVQRLMRRSRRLLPELVLRLAQQTGVDCEHRRAGLLLAGEVVGQGAEWLARTDMHAVPGRVGDFESALSGPDRSAVLFAEAGQVRHRRLRQALVLSLAARGVAVWRGRRAARLRVAGNIVLGVELAGGARVDADAVVLAGGSGANPLLFDSGLEPLDIDPPRSPLLLLNPVSRLLGRMVNTGEVFLLPRPDGRILAGPVIDAPADARVPPDFEELTTRVLDTLPALSGFDLEARWFGFGAVRAPVPSVGAYPQLRGLWVNAGHFRAGLGIATAAAELLADQLSGGPTVPGLAARLAGSRHLPVPIRSTPSRNLPDRIPVNSFMQLTRHQLKQRSNYHE